MAMVAHLVAAHRAPRQHDRHPVVGIAAVLEHLGRLPEGAVGEPRRRFHPLVKLPIRIGHDLEHEVGDRATVAGFFAEVGHQPARAAAGVG